MSDRVGWLGKARPYRARRRDESVDRPLQSGDPDLGEKLAAVEDASADPGGRLRGEKDRGLTHQLGRLDVLFRDLRATARVLPAFGEDHSARRKAVDRNPVRRELAREPAVEALHRRFRNPVGVAAAALGRVGIAFRND